MTFEFDRQNHTILISDTERVELRELYSAIRDWEYDNMTEPDVTRGCGFFPISTGAKTSPIVTLIGGWKVSSETGVSIVGGLFRAEDEEGNFVSPVAPAAGDNITVRN